MYTFRDLLESGKTYSMDEQKSKKPWLLLEKQKLLI